MKKIKLIQVILTTLTMLTAVKMLSRLEWFSQGSIFLQIVLGAIGGAIVWALIAYVAARLVRKTS